MKRFHNYSRGNENPSHGSVSGCSWNNFETGHHKFKWNVENAISVVVQSKRNKIFFFIFTDLSIMRSIKLISTNSQTRIGSMPTLLFFKCDVKYARSNVNFESFFFNFFLKIFFGNFSMTFNELKLRMNLQIHMKFELFKLFGKWVGISTERI